MSIKKTPCNECRERKRRCSYELPSCERCKKNNIQCVYTIRKTPADEEYIKQVNILNEIDQLNSQLDTMQKEMDTLRILSTTNSPYIEGISSPPSFSSTSPSQSTLSSLSSVSTMSSPSESSLTLSQITSDQYSKVIKRQRTQYGLEAIVEQQQHYHHQQQQQQKLPQQQNNDSSSKTDYSWKLTVSKGNLVIHTDIKTHAELLDYLCKSVTALEMNEFVPYSINDTKPRNMILSKMIQIFVWKRYGKSRFKSILSGKPNNIKPVTLMIENESTYSIGENNDISITKDDNHNEYIEFMIQQFLQQHQLQLQHESINSITLKLLHAYFQCQHLNHLAIHVPTFLQLFVRDQVMESPVALALCAVACSTSCHHIHNVLQNQNILIYSYYYFNRTRDLMADMFDHLDLESFATYVLLAFHKFLLFQFENARLYADMAERLLNLLEDTFNEDETSEEKIKKGYYASEKILFDRLKVQLSKIVAVIELTKHQKKLSYNDHFHPKKQNEQLPKPGMYSIPNRRVLNIFHGTSNYLKPALGDSEQEKRHIMLSAYISNLNKECHDAAQHAPSNDTANYVGIIGHMLEMTMRRWYASLPDSFRLNIPIFDEFDNTDYNNNSSNNKSKLSLALDQIIDVVPLLSTMTVYNEYLMMTMAHLSKGPDDIKTRTCIAEYWDKARFDMNNDYIRKQWGEKWVHRLERMDHIYEYKIKPQYSQYEKDDSENEDDDSTRVFKELMNTNGSIGKKAKMDEHVKIITSVLISGYADFDDPVAVLSVTVANNTLLLLQYIKLRYPCYFDIRIALNVCRVLIRASRFNYGDKPMKLKIQANMICCLSMIREEFDRSPIHASVNEAICKIEKEYDDVLRMNMFE